MGISDPKLIHSAQQPAVLLCFTAFILLLSACASGPALNSTEEHATIKTALVPGEQVIQANSCSRLPSLGIMDSQELEFGGCYLTNLRLVFEESGWYRAMKTAAEFVPSQGDFGISQLASGGGAVLNNYFIIHKGQQGELSIVQKDSRLIIPLSEIERVEIVEQESAFMAMLANEKSRGKRNFMIVAKSGEGYLFEVYDFPPHKTAYLHKYLSEAWVEQIRATREQSFGNSNR